MEELNKKIEALYAIMDAHPDGRNVWRAQNVGLARELDDLEAEYDDLEADEIERRMWETVTR